MMKRIICITLLMALTLSLLCSCGNMSMGFGNFNFKHIHFTDGAGASNCATVERWYDSESGGIEVKTKEFGAMFLSEARYILFETAEDCPFCHFHV